MEIEVEKIGSREKRIQVSANVKDGIWDLAKRKNIGWTDALEFGILFLIADADGGLEFNYPESRLKLKLDSVVKLLNEKCAEIERLEEKYGKTKE